MTLYYTFSLATLKAVHLYVDLHDVQCIYICIVVCAPVFLHTHSQRCIHAHTHLEFRALHVELCDLTFSGHLCWGSWLWPDVLSWGFDASSCNLSETLGTPVLALIRHANTCGHMVACCLTLLGQQESLERQAATALQDTMWHMLTPYSP